MNSPYMKSYLSEDDQYNLQQQYPQMKSAPSASSTGGGVESGVAAGAATGNPYLAAASVGGSFLTAYMAQKAKEEADRKAALMEAMGSHAQNQNQAFNNLLSTYRTVLR